MRGQILSVLHWAGGEEEAEATGVAELRSPPVSPTLLLWLGNQSLLCKGSLCSPAGQGSPGTRTQAPVH